VDADRDKPTPSGEIERLYGTLRAIAEDQMRQERAGHTLQATAVVHEAYIRLAGLEDGSWTDRNHFLSLAASAIRRVLVDHARGKNRLKRGGDSTPITLHSGMAESPETKSLNGVDVISLDEALDRLAAEDNDLAQIVVLRFFGGMTLDEVAEHLSVGRTTAALRWRTARAWLKRELSDATIDRAPPTGEG
jgi:RNA polymerase sigma-70 factor (ECF subfamily)